MSDRDRSNQERGFDNPSRRESQGSDRPPANSTSRGRSYAEDDETFDLPGWTEPAPRTGSRDSANRNSSIRRPSSQPDVRPSSRREPIPELGDAFRKTGRRTAPADQPELSSDSNEPYDRLRRVASMPSRQIEFDTPDDDREGYEDDFDRHAPAPRERDKSRRPGKRRAPAASVRSNGTTRQPAGQQIGGMISSAAPQMRFIAAVAGIGLISLVFMAATVAGRMGSLPDWIPIHLNAEGTPDKWGTSSTLWRIPVMVVFVSLMSAAVAWAVGKRDAFAVRFALGSTLLIHALCWIALVNLAW